MEHEELVLRYGEPPLQLTNEDVLNLHKDTLTMPYETSAEWIVAWTGSETPTEALSKRIHRLYKLSLKLRNGNLKSFLDQTFKANVTDVEIPPPSDAIQVDHPSLAVTTTTSDIPAISGTPMTSVSQFTSEFQNMDSKLSVEQMEMIRRLRHSGVTVQQIAETYQTLDKLDKDLGSFEEGTANNELNFYSLRKDSLVVENPPSSSQSSDQSTQQLCDKKNSNVLLLSSQKASEINTPSNDATAVNATDEKMDNGLSKGAVKEASICFLLSLPKECIVDLIKKCSSVLPTCEYFDPCVLNKYFGITTDQTATFLNGELSKLLKEPQSTVIDWFINILCKADWFIKDVIQYSQDVMKKELTSDGIIDFTPKRDRFCFNDVHFTVLESNFQRKRYPTMHEKILIANECNLKMAIHLDRSLLEKEKVAVITVDHWFRNKRKDRGLLKTKIAESNREMAERARLKKLAQKTDVKKMETPLAPPATNISKACNSSQDSKAVPIGCIYQNSATKFAPVNTAFRPLVSILSPSTQPKLANSSSFLPKIMNPAHPLQQQPLSLAPSYSDPKCNNVATSSGINTIDNNIKIKEEIELEWDEPEEEEVGEEEEEEKRSEVEQTQKSIGVSPFKLLKLSVPS